MSNQPFSDTKVIDKWTAYVNGNWHKAEAVTRQTAFLVLPHLRLHELEDAVKYPDPYFLEVGAGSGASAALAFSELQVPVNQVVTDYTPAMLDKAAEVLPESIKFVQADGMDLMFKDGQFDRYWSNYVIHLVPNPEAMAKEAFRVLNSNGIATFTFFGRPENSPQFTFLNSVCKTLGIQLAAAPHDPFTLGRNLETTTRDMFLNAGFKTVQVMHSTVSMALRNGAEFWDINDVPGTSFSSKLASLSDEQREQVKAAFIKGVDEEIAAGRFPGRHENSIVVCHK